MCMAPRVVYLGNRRQRDFLGFPLRCAMGWESHYHGAAGDLTESAGLARHIIAICRWADDDAATGRGVGKLGCVFRQQDDNRGDAEVCKFVSMGRVVCRQIDGETIVICPSNDHTVSLSVVFVPYNSMMGVYEPPPAFI